LGGLKEKASGFSIKWLLDKLINIKNSSRPVPPEGDVSDVYGGPICPRLSVLS
jgi:hypothetical protein